MTDAGFFKGTTADQDSRFSDKNKKLMKTMKFADNIDKKIDMKKIRLELMRPYITNILSTLTTVEDEVMVEYVFSQLEEKQHPDGKLIQIMMTGFLGKTKARTFMGELWSTLLEAQTSPHGIPAELIELKREEMQKKKVEENKISASVNKNKEEIERSLNMDHRRAPVAAAQNQQTSATRARSPPRVIKDTFERSNGSRFSDERRDYKKPDSDSKQMSHHRQRRSRTRSRSRSPKYQSRRQRSSNDKSPARRHDSHRNEREKYEDRKSSRQFREKTPDTVEAPAKEKMMDSKLKALEITSEAKETKATVDEIPKDKMEVDGSDSSSSGSSDSESGSGSSDSDSGSGSTSSSGSESDANSSASSTTSSKKLKKKRKQPQEVVSAEAALNGDGVKCAKVEGDSDVHAKVVKVEVVNGGGDANGGEVKEVAPLQRILQAEKRKESHRSGRDNVEDDGRRRRRDEEDRRRRDEEDRRRRDDDDRRRRHEQEARRYEEDRRRRDEEERRQREKEERRREEDRRLRYEEDRRREERRHREKEQEKHARSHRNRSDSDSDDSELKKSSSRHKKKKSGRDESDRKKSKKSKKSRLRDRDHEGHRSGKTDTAEMEKSLREKALESLASKRLKEESNSN